MTKYNLLLCNYRSALNTGASPHRSRVSVSPIGFEILAHEQPWPSHPIIHRPRWTGDTWHAPILHHEAASRSLSILLWVFSCLSLKDSPVTQTGVSGVNFYYWFLRGGAFAPLGPAGRPEIAHRKEKADVVPHNVSLNCFGQAVVRSINPWNCFWNEKTEIWYSFL